MMPRRLIHWPTLVVVVVLGGHTPPVQAQVNQDAFERLRALNAVFKDPARADLDVVRRALKSALADPDDGVRAAAVDLIGSFRGRQLYGFGNPSAAVWQRFVPLAAEFRPAVLAALTDPSVRVRGKAVSALAVTDVEIIPGAGGPPQVRIPPALAERLQQLASDDASVRSRIVNFFGRSTVSHDPATLAIARSVLLRGLEDTDPYVVQFAGSAMYEWRIPEALPLLVKQLGHTSQIARMGVAQGLQGYGATARPYLPQIEEAVKREPDGPTKKTLEAAVTRIRENR